MHGEVEPIAAFAGGGGLGGEFDVSLERGAEEAFEHGRGLDLEIGREGLAPGEELLGKRLGHRARPDVDPAVPREAKLGEGGRDGVGAVEIELQQTLITGAGSGGFAGGPLPAAFAVPDLLTRRIARAGEELGLEVFGRVGLGVGGAPALDDRAQRHAAHASLEGGGQTQTGRTESGHEPGVGQHRGGNVPGGQWRRSAEHASAKKIKRRGFLDDDPRLVGRLTVGGEEAEFEAVALNRGDGGLGHERFGLDHKRGLVGAKNGVAGGGCRQQRGGGVG